MQFIDDEAEHSSSDNESRASQVTAPPPTERPFRINAQRFLLTYPHYNQTPNEVLRILDNIKPISRAIACLELHQDGEPHVHVAVEFTRRINSSNGKRLFELEGAHPNIGAARNWAACVNYCCMEKAIEVGFFGAVSAEEIIRTSAGNRELEARTDARDLFAICDECDTLPQWIQACIDRRVSQAFCKWIWDIKYGDRPPDFAANVPLPDIVHDIRLRTTSWGNGGGSDNRALVICGPTGIGKTSWAMANIPCGGPPRTPNKWLLVTHIDDLRHFDPRIHCSILFDELRWDGELDHNNRRHGKRPLQDQIKILTWDTPVSIHCRYGVARIPAHIMKIFTCTNSICFTNEPQVRRRVRVMNLYDDREIEDLWTTDERSD